MKKFRYCIYLICIIVFSSPLVGQIADQIEKDKPIVQGDSVVVEKTTADSLLALALNKDSLSADTIKPKKGALEALVDYRAKDSIVFVGGNLGYLYGEAQVDYTTISLKAENITMNMDSSIVNAAFGLDSVGAEFGYPIFSDGGGSYESKSMRYNFKTKKGYARHTITEQGEGTVIADRAKMNDDGSFFMCDGKYTTCDHDHPHFYLMLTKAKVRPKKDIITGPAYLVIEDLPLPIGLPFAFFPFTDKYSSGVIMPSPTDELERGFGLRDGGYYLALNDNVDLALRGEIWTKGSWGLNARSTYLKRYKYSGSFDMNYLYTKYGDKEDPDYNVSKDFKISWSHAQDPKANMYRTLSASVDFSTSSYNRNQLNELYNANTTNTKGSTVTMTQKFPNSPFTLSGSMSANQISRDTTVSLTLPNLSVSMSRIYPFKRKEKIGDERWYEKIQLSYTGDFRNSITTKENKLFKSSLQKDWSNGMKHTIPVSATFNLFKYLNISPAFNYTERWYMKGIKQRWDATRGQNGQNVNGDTINSFKRVFDFNYSLSFQTKLYGFYEPLFKIGKLQKIRHVFTPSVSFNGRPDFSDPMWGFYETYSYIDGNGDKKHNTYSPYSQEIFGAPGKGKSGNINFAFDNNLEMKLGAVGDSAKIISLIDNLGISFGYNMMAKEFKWSDINTNLRLKLSKSLTVNVSAAFDPYTYTLDQYGNPQRVDKLRIAKKGTFGRLMNTSYSISPSINQDTFKKLFGKEDKSKDKDEDKNKSSENDEDAENTESASKKSLFEKSKNDDGEYDADGYLINDIKWNLAANYSFNYGYDRSRFDKEALEYKRKLTHNFGLNGSFQPTKNWSFNFSTNYDFEFKKFAHLNCSLTRNLHCWSLTASFIPIGPYKSYFVSLRASSSMLQDLKYETRGRSSSFDPQWY